MMWLIGFVGSKVGRLVAGALGALGMILLVFRAGQKDQEQKNEIEDLESYKDTREAIDEVPVSTDVDAALERLSKSKGLRL
jgi:hypothetical protein